MNLRELLGVMIRAQLENIAGRVGDAFDFFFRVERRLPDLRENRVVVGDIGFEGFEQDDYVKNGGFNDRTLADLAGDFAQVRGASLALFLGLAGDAWQQRGVANKNEVTVRALAFIIAGHELHHRRILEEKYLPAIPRA